MRISAVVRDIPSSFSRGGGDGDGDDGLVVDFDMIWQRKSDWFQCAACKTGVGTNCRPVEGDMSCDIAMISSIGWKVFLNISC